MTNSGEQAKLLQVAREAKAAASKAENSQRTNGEQRLANAMRRRVIADGRAREAEQRVADEARRLADPRRPSCASSASPRKRHSETTP
jgi:hypothetical protein